MRKPGFSLVLLLTVLACGQESVAPTTEAVASFAAADVNKNQVVRYQDHFAISWTDPSNGLRATHTTFNVPLFGEPEPDCGPQEDLALIDFKQVGVIDPVDFFASVLHLKASGSVWVIVRDMNQPGDCYGVKLVAEGPGEIRYVDNSALGVQPGGRDKNEWSYNASGTLTTPDGRVLDYKGDAHYTLALIDEEPALTRALEKVSLR